MRPAILLSAALASVVLAGTIDRVAIVIDKQVITESEVETALRLTEFLNEKPLDLSAAARRAEADHMVDQELLRRELDASGFAKPAESQADTLLRSFRQQRFRSTADYRAALARYGITEEELKERLLWQVTALHFTDFRFGSTLAADTTQSADRAAPGAPVQTVDQRMDTWLKDTRKDTKITFKPEAFQ